MSCTVRIHGEIQNGIHVACRSVDIGDVKFWEKKFKEKQIYRINQETIFVARTTRFRYFPVISDLEPERTLPYHSL